MNFVRIDETDDGPYAVTLEEVSVYIINNEGSCDININLNIGYQIAGSSIQKNPMQSEL